MATQALQDLLNFIESTFGITVSEDRIAGWEEELAAGTGRNMTDLRSDVLKHVVGEDKLKTYIGEQFESRGLSADDERITRIAGEFLTEGRQFNEFQSTLDDFGTAADTSTGGGIFLGGGQLTRITRAGQDSLWAITYTYAGIQHVYTFAGLKDMENSLGVGAWGSGTFDNLTLDESEVNDGDTWLLGDADMFVGQTGTYQGFFSDLMREAGLEAGSRNAGWAGRFANDAEVQRIIAMSTQGNWSDARQLAELRLTGIYQELYPGLDTLISAGSVNPENDWHIYMADVSEGLSALGYAKDTDGTYRSLMADMLGQQITAGEFKEFVPVFVRAEQSPEFAAALNKWTEQDLGMSIGFEEWFDVLAGTSTPELNQVVEKATLQFVADSSGTTLSDEQISRLAELTEISEQQMRLAFNEAEQALLSVGSGDLARFGLTEQALVSAAFGLESAGADPLSTDGTPFTSAEISKRARKARIELGLEDDRKANFFVGFDPQGRPTRGGLAASAPEAG